MNDRRYPIGQFEHIGPVLSSDIDLWISQIEALPEQMTAAVRPLNDEQLDTPYRPGGWTLRQVVHHVPDSHMNCFIRFKWALTEKEPLIKAYDEVLWAELEDYRILPVQTSLAFLSALHRKWVVLLRSLSGEQLARRFIHPVSGPSTLAWNIGNYSWHGRHHLAHITSTVERNGWSFDELE